MAVAVVVGCCVRESAGARETWAAGARTAVGVQNAGWALDGAALIADGAVVVADEIVVVVVVVVIVGQIDWEVASHFGTTARACVDLATPGDSLAVDVVTVLEAGQ